jgi:hypothetical protein
MFRLPRAVAGGAPVGIFRRSRPKTPLLVVLVCKQVAARPSRPKVLCILLELEPTAWFSTAL